MIVILLGFGAIVCVCAGVVIGTFLVTGAAGLKALEDAE